jgi:hypothetical protein
MNYHSDTEYIANAEHTKCLQNALKETIYENEIDNILIIS